MQDRKLIESEKCKILILYDVGSVHVSTIAEHLISFGKYSNHNFFYASASGNAECDLDLSIFDAVIIHYSIRLSITDHLSSKYVEALKKFHGYKMAFIQDEYDGTELARQWIESLSITIVFTCVPAKYLNNVYPKKRFPNVTFVQTLTGYVPLDYLKLRQYIKPMHERKNVIGHRSRHLPYWYGNLGREKYIIAVKMREMCELYSLSNDIEWSDSKRIYGKAWFEFIAENKATLGTESGANVFDEFGLIRQNIEKDLQMNSLITYEEIFEKHLAEHEGRIAKMNQISPRIFESIAVKTVLILFEGVYSEVLLPNVHYIPLKKDFSNIDDIIKKLNDNSFLESMSERAYADIILSGNFSYQKFIMEFDDILQKKEMHGINNTNAISETIRKNNVIKEFKQFFHDIKSLIYYEDMFLN